MKNPVMLAAMCAATVVLAADEERFHERFADPATRAESLSELVPGTTRWYFHHALASQLAGRDAEFRQVLDEWRTAAARDGSPVSAVGIAMMENRQLLLRHEENPAESAAELARRLGLEFDDERPDAVAANRRLPTRVDAGLLGEAAFEEAAARSEATAPYRKYSGKRLLRELGRVEEFDDEKVRWFLQRLKRADLPGVVPLVDRGLTMPRPVAFGTAEVHGKLTEHQLRALLELHPDLRANEKFCLSLFAKMRPGARVDFQRDRAAHAAYLATCAEFAATLPPAMGKLKVHILFHHLRMQREAGNHPRDGFLEYLTAAGHRADGAAPRDAIPRRELLAGDYGEVTGCPPVRDDSELVDAMLEHFLAGADDPGDFAMFVEARALERIHARARLMAGGDTATWGTRLGPAGFRELQEETHLSFAPGAPDLLAAGDEVTLALDLKNTPELRLRIFELDATTGEEADVDVDLDGLFPHHERTLRFAHAPILRHRESIELPELAGAGRWVVEFVSGGRSARALVRKGMLTPVIERTADAQVVRVFDETGGPVRNAEVRLGREVHKADADGAIRIPDAAHQVVLGGVVAAGKLAAPLRLGQRVDEPSLDVRFHLEREQLLADVQTALPFRVRLTNHGREIPLDRLENPALVLKATLAGGTTTERVIAEDLKLEPAMEIPFQVPGDLTELHITLRGSYTPRTGGDAVKLRGSATYRINGDLKESRIGTIFFSPVAGGHRLEARGRNGEPLPSRALRLACHRFDYDEPVYVDVRTGDDGRVDLGTLDGVDYIEASGGGLPETLYEIRPDAPWTPAEITAPPGEEIRIAMREPMETPDRSVVSLLETVDGAPLRDHFGNIATEDGWFVIRGLGEGDYEFRQDDDFTRIHISGGQAHDGWLVSPSRVARRHVPAQPLIANATPDGGRLLIRLRGHDAETRVSVVGRRYRFADWSPGSGFSVFPPPRVPSLAPGFHACTYLTGERLSDETRYILDRRAAPVFPGSMLPRPGRLIHRWSDADLDQSILPPLEGAAGEGRSGGASAAPRRDAPSEKRERDDSTGTDEVCDFLGTPAVLRFNLQAADDGTLEVPLDGFEDCQFLEIVASAPFAGDRRTVPLPGSDPRTRDRRIARPFDPASHHVATRAAAVLEKGATAEIENLLDADWRAFTTLADVHQFLYGQTADERLRDFVFLTEWPDLPEARKLDLMEQHRCHELHLFLARKDPEFFQRFVKPFLAAKPEPGFIDDYLLERDLTQYLRPYAWARLNAAEKALLARALPDSRETIARELSLRWENEAPPPEAEARLFARTLRGSDLSLTDSLGMARRELREGAADSRGMAYLTDKLHRIVIPRIDFEDVTLDEALDFLRLRASELDTLDLDPARKGVNIATRNVGGRDPGKQRIRELKVRNVPLATALKYICDATQTRFTNDGDSIRIVPATETGEDLFTRTFDVPPDFAAALDVTDTPSSDDPFAEPSDPPSSLRARPPISELLKRAGIQIPDGASATLSPSGKLVVTNTPTELDKIESLTAAIHSGPSAGAAPAGGFAMEDEHELDVPDAEATDPFAVTPGAAALRVEPPDFPERTRAWREAEYFRNAGPGDESLIALNRFWLDLAAWDGAGGFRSARFNECATNANEALMCLAVLDLPFRAERPEVTTEGGRLRVKAREPMLLFYKDTRVTEDLAADSPLLVRQTWLPAAEPFRTEQGRQVENAVTGDFRPGTAYTALLVVTNPTGVGRRVDLLAQIPAGSIPLAGKPSTLAVTRDVAPHGVVMEEMTFYFPAPGDFGVYPFHVSENGRVLAHTGARTLRVAADSGAGDGRSWSEIALNGNDEEVLGRLREANLANIDLSLILWRLRDRDFFMAATKLLRERLHFAPRVSAYGFHHRDAAAMRDFLENSEAVRQLGSWLDSPLLDVRPVAHLDWRTIDFDPLVNPRAHRLAEHPRMTHKEAREHYLEFLKQLGWKPELDSADHFAWAVLLLLQDRIEEGLARFDLVDPAALPGTLPYDYLHCVVLFLRERAADARGIAEGRLATLPPGLWRGRFEAVIAQADEIAAAATAGDSGVTPPAAEAPRLEIEPAGESRIVLRHHGLADARLRLYAVDLEMLFSKKPFLDSKSGTALPPIRPNEALDVTLPGGSGDVTVDLPASLRHGNLLVSAEAGDVKLLRVLESRSLDLRHIPAERTIQAVSRATSRPLPKAYVKVYAETTDGRIAFHKDGYTDLRGKFDYLSHTGEDPARIKRVAILVSHPEHGARTVIHDR